jgi:hypothetical protein
MAIFAVPFHRFALWLGPVRYILLGPMLNSVKEKRDEPAKPCAWVPVAAQLGLQMFSGGSSCTPLSHASLSISGRSVIKSLLR